jgi:Bacterial transcriptional activator domain
VQARQSLELAGPAAVPAGAAERELRLLAGVAPRRPRSAWPLGDTGAFQAAEDGLTFDNLNEALWRLAMQAESRLGLRDSINQRCQRLRNQLDQQLGIQPEIVTRALSHELLGQR